MMVRLTISCLFALFLSAAAAAQTNAPLAFQAGLGDGEFQFDTGILRGKLRAGGRTLGLSSVVHVPTGVVLDASMGLFSHYRVFSFGKRYGGGVWDMPSRAVLRADGSVQVTVRGSEEQPFELRATYRWKDPATLDLVTIVHATGDLAGFEVFLASYFSPHFTNAFVLARTNASSTLIPASRAAGYWQMFVRDHLAADVVKDGRWTLPPNPVEWTLCGTLAHPLAVRRAPEVPLDVFLMAPERECFAVALPYESEPHYSTYLSLFGRDLKADETARAHSRLTVRPRLRPEDAVRLYEEYREALPTQ